MDDALGAAHHNDVRAPQPDHVQALGDGFVARRAGRNRSVDTCFGPDVEGEVGGGGVGHQHRDGPGADAAGPAVALNIPGADERLQPTDAGADRHPDAFGIEAAIGVEAGVSPGLEAGDHGELGGAIHLAGLDPIQHRGRIDGRLGGNPRRQAFSPLVIEGVDSAATREESLPGAGDIAAEGAGGAQARDNDSSSHGGYAPNRETGVRSVCRRRPWPPHQGSKREGPPHPEA